MNTNKTLADVQPGGRVRLGDALPPLPKMQRFTNLYGETYAYSAEQMHDYARAALSAQPSPGGQGDAQTIEKLRAMMDHSFGGPGFVVYGTAQSIAEVERRLAPGIAARQPVGEPVALVVPGAPTRCRHCESTDLEWFAHVRAVNDVPHGRLTTHDVGCVFVLGCNECSETLHTVKADSIAALLAAPPAQAVDLGQIWQQAFNDTAHSYRRNKSRMWVLKILKERVQALIDSQAVGK